MSGAVDLISSLDEKLEKLTPINSEAVDLISSLDEKLEKLTPTNPEACIFRVHSELREVHEKAYQPCLLAIGPYHHGKNGLNPMEYHKLRYLKSMLQRTKESSVKRHIMALRELEEKARGCYADEVSLTVDEFVEMMLVDGCFIVELFRMYANKNSRNDSDTIFQMRWMLPGLKRDLLLLENQLPFFVLTKLFEMTKVTEEPEVTSTQEREIIFSTEEHDFTEEREVIISTKERGVISTEQRKVISTEESEVISLAHEFFKGVGPSSLCAVSELKEIPEIHHLLSLIHTAVCPSFAQKDLTARALQSSKYGNSVPCATKLIQGGIKFKKSLRGDLFDIKFNNGVMKIPPLKIDDDTESFLRNLIAYEQYKPVMPPFVSDYLSFMDCLINSPRDAQLLRGLGIIVSYLGDDDVISNMFNKIGTNVMLHQIYYAEVCGKVNKHCSKRRYKWLSTLRRDFFNTPWALLSFLAAFFMLLLTLMQTIFSILSFINR